MPVILSIESSTKTSSVALHEDGKLVCSQHIHLEKSHSQYLASSIKHLIEVSGMDLKILDAVAISKGPGSYTGLRIGTSTAKGLCYGLDIPLIGINTLEAMAHGMTRYHHFEDILYCPMLDARRMEVYCLITDRNLKIIEEVQARVIEENTFSTLLQNNKVVFFGDGAAKCRSFITHPDHAIFIDDIHPSAEHVGELAWEKYEQEKFEDAAYFEPFYLKDFIAKKPSRRNLV